MEGGAIGLELTGAVSRPFMMEWDLEYLSMVKESGMVMRLYKRYVDDSNQVAEVPPVGVKYDCTLRRIVQCEEMLAMVNEEEDARLARVLREVANCVMEGIIMEADFPSKNGNERLAILDMEVWGCKREGIILHQHYEKAVSSREVMHAKSAHSSSCMRSVHTQEILRRMLNTSTDLEWEKYGAPVITDYMLRMRQAGNGEGMRKNALRHAANIYASMRKDDESGLRPMYREKNFQRIERKKQKSAKKHNWSTKGGYIAPIMVPSTPNGELAKALRGVVEQEQQGSLKFKIVETGGITIKSRVQKSNPYGTLGCDDRSCVPCKDGKGGGGDCRKTNVQYRMDCKLCPENNPTVYIGETSRNLFTRAGEHLQGYRAKRLGNFITEHQRCAHNGATADFSAKVTNTFRDCMTRLVSEAVSIRRSEVEVLNSKSEWHQPALFSVRNEIVRG